MAVSAPSIGGIGGRIAKVPKLVWVLGGGVILAYVILRGKGGGTTAAPVVSGGTTGTVTDGGGGGGTVSTEPTQPALSSADLSTFLADQAAQNADFRSGITDLIGGLQPPTPVGGTPPPVTGPPGGTIGPVWGPGGPPTGGDILPTRPPIPTPSPTKPGPAVGQFTIHLRGLTNIYNAKGAKIGTGRTGTSVGTLVNIKGKSFYKTIRGGKTVFIPKTAKSITATPKK